MSHGATELCAQEELTSYVYGVYNILKNTNIIYIYDDLRRFPCLSCLHLRYSDLDGGETPAPSGALWTSFVIPFSPVASE